MIDIQQRINLLRREINKHRYHYYILNKPLISDFEYDMLEKMLKDLEEQYPQFDTPDSPTHTVGSDILKNTQAS